MDAHLSTTATVAPTTGLVFDAISMTAVPATGPHWERVRCSATCSAISGRYRAIGGWRQDTVAHNAAPGPHGLGWWWSGRCCRWTWWYGRRAWWEKRGGHGRGWSRRRRRHMRRSAAAAVQSRQEILYSIRLDVEDRVQGGRRSWRCRRRGGGWSRASFETSLEKH